MSSWELKEGEEQITRDIERAEEYQQLTARVTAIGLNRYELSTGLTIAARYADKLRRVAIVALGKVIPRDIIIRDISELNKLLYEEIVNKMKVGKLEVIRILVDAVYDESEKKLKFENIRVQRFYDEEKVNSMIKQYEERIRSLEEENSKLKEELEKIKSKLEKFNELIIRVQEVLKL